MTLTDLLIICLGVVILSAASSVEQLLKRVIELLESILHSQKINTN